MVVLHLRWTAEGGDTDGRLQDDCGFAPSEKDKGGLQRVVILMVGYRTIVVLLRQRRTREVCRGW